MIHTLKSANWDVIVASSSQVNSYTEELQNKGISTFPIQLNDSKFDQWIQDIQPDFVIFDRFITEEQYGWRVKKFSPFSVRILDTQDLHFLRRAREKALKAQTPLSQIFSCNIDLYTEDTYREISSIYRSDCTLLLSDFEERLLSEKFNIPKSFLHTSRFHYSTPLPSKKYEERKDFFLIGNFRHPPNLDGIRWFHREIWPLIRKELPNISVHIYGSYPSKEMMQLTNPNIGFYVLGPIDNPFRELTKHRVNLAPLRFGAGIKGKISDGWWTGTPVVTTPIGSEGMSENLAWGGEIATDPEDFAKKAVLLYTDSQIWNQKHENSLKLIQEFYSENINSSNLVDRFIHIKSNLNEIRKNNIIGSILNLNIHRSTEFFSRWIEAKNKLACQNQP